MALTIPVTDLKLHYFHYFFFPQQLHFFCLAVICSIAKAVSALCREFNLWDLLF